MQGNLMNLHSHKYSGLANAKTIHVHHHKPEGATGSGHIKVTTRKPASHHHKHANSKHHSNIRAGSGSRRSLGIVSGQSKRNYRPDLRHVSLFDFISFIFLPFSFSFSPTRNDVRTLRTLLYWGGMNDGRGHVCQIDPPTTFERSNWM